MREMIGVVKRCVCLCEREKDIVERRKIYSTWVMKNPGDKEDHDKGDDVDGALQEALC